MIPLFRRFLCALCALCFIFPLRACEKPAPPGPPGEMITIAAASDLKFALDQVLLGFVRQNPDVDVQTTYASSGTLAAQIAQGAPFDLFLSADESYPRRLIEQGAASADSLAVYAVGHLVVWTRTDSPLDVATLGERALTAPSVKKIAIANPAHAPYGRAAEAALKSLGLHDKVQDKLVLGENIAQAAQFVESGNAEVGIISLSLALAPPMKEQGRYWRVPPVAYPPIRQALVLPTKSKSPAAARRFREFLLSPEAAAIFARFGFSPPG